MKTQQNKDILKYPFLNWQIFQARVVILFFFQGKLTFKESLQPILHRGFKNKYERSKFRHLFFEYITERYGTFGLYGHSFFPAFENYVEAIGFIDQVIKKDQYQVKLIKDGDVVIDAGANIGVFSAKVAHDFPGSKVYSFEPTPHTFEVLKKNTEFYPNIICLNLGLGDEVAEKTLSIWDDSSGSSSIALSALAEFGEPDRTQIIRITTLDKAAKDLPRVDFIKMDTEGYEANILKGAERTIQKWRPIIVMSAYHNPKDKEELPKLLKSIYPDYVCELRHDSEEDLICISASRHH